MNLRFLNRFNFSSLLHLLIILTCVLLMLDFFSLFAVADGVRLPGEDASAKMESAGTLMRFIDTALFRWAARLLAGICIFGAAWNLKEMRLGAAVISLVSAILFGTAPTWVKNIFSVGSDTVFSYSSLTQPTQSHLPILASTHGADGSQDPLENGHEPWVASSQEGFTHA